VARDLADQLAEELRDRFAEVVVHTDERVGALNPEPDVDLVQIVRRRMLDEGWDLAICVTDLPLLVGRRPVKAHAAVSLGVGIVSVPALGAMDLEERLQEAVAGLIDRLLGSEDETITQVAAAGRGNLSLLVGMVWANRPWQLAAGLSRALVGALGTGALALASTGVWHLADGAGWVRLAALTAGSLLIISVSLIVIHRLWERNPARSARPRVTLINLATLLTIALGIGSLYLVLFVLTFGGGAALIPSGVLSGELGHSVGVDEYLRLAWLTSSLATLGGALGAAIESERAVREAAYGYRPHESRNDS
jgi:hypothetical protein